MFIGVLDERGEAIDPAILGRVASEAVTWSVEYKATNSVLITNLNALVMPAYGSVKASATKISMFREIDDLQPFVPVFDLGGPQIEKGDRIAFEPRSLKLSLNFHDNRPDIEHVWDEVDAVRDEAAKHLQFIHELAYSANGDLRALARNYLKQVGVKHKA